MDEALVVEQRGARVLALKLVLLLVWAAVSFGVASLARELQFAVAGWPLGYWMAAQGSVLAFIAIVAVYAGVMSRWDAAAERDPGDGDA
jgi:putative solute:sodium symporter small subunit